MSRDRVFLVPLLVALCFAVLQLAISFSVPSSVFAADTPSPTLYLPTDPPPRATDTPPPTVTPVPATNTPPATETPASTETPAPTLTPPVTATIAPPSPYLVQVQSPYVNPYWASVYALPDEFQLTLITSITSTLPHTFTHVSYPMTCNPVGGHLPFSNPPYEMTIHCVPPMPACMSSWDSSQALGHFAYEAGKGVNFCYFFEDVTARICGPTGCALHTLPSFCYGPGESGDWSVDVFAPSDIDYGVFQVDYVDFTWDWVGWDNPVDWSLDSAHLDYVVGDAPYCTAASSSTLTTTQVYGGALWYLPDQSSLCQTATISDLIKVDVSVVRDDYPDLFEPAAPWPESVFLTSTCSADIFDTVVDSPLSSYSYVAHVADFCRCGFPGSSWFISAAPWLGVSDHFYLHWAFSSDNGETWDDGTGDTVVFPWDVEPLFSQCIVVPPDWLISAVSPLADWSPVQAQLCIQADTIRFLGWLSFFNSPLALGFAGLVVASALALLRG